MLPLSMVSNSYNELQKRMKKIMILGETMGILQWDNQTYMPRKGIMQRSEQLGTLSRIIHEELTDPKTGTLLEQAWQQENLSEIQNRNLELWQKEYDQQTKIPKDLVEEFTKQRSKTQHLWEEAKQKNNFKLIQEDFEKLFELAKETATKLDEDIHPYDNLVDMYEPKMTQDMISRYFNTLQTGVKEVYQKILTVPNRISSEILKIHATTEQQRQLSKILMDFVGLPADRSRLDTVEHPFTTGAYDDVRITTHYLEEDPMGSFYSVMHEAGHARYELDLPQEYRYTAIGSAAGLGVHESQSRFVENMLGRDPAFLRFILPKIQKIIPAFKKIDQNQFVQAVNYVSPSKIRIYADEVTYSLHIILRFEIEKMLFNDQISIADLPQLWKDKSEELLGVQIQNDQEGILQDTHWYSGMFGYFPDYALGNVYDGQILYAMEKDIPDWQNYLEKGIGAPMIDWLDEKIHKKGALYDPAELILKATGQEPSATAFTQYLKSKYNRLF